MIVEITTYEAPVNRYGVRLIKEHDDVEQGEAVGTIVLGEYYFDKDDAMRRATILSKRNNCKIVEEVI